MFITAGQATVSVSLDEPVPSESAGPLVEGTVTKAGAQVFSFDLFRVGQFTANVQSKSGVTPWEGKLQQRSPDGTVVASSQSNRLDFPVTLRTIDQSRDAAGQVRPWSLEIDTATPLGVGSAVRATVIATARIPVVLFQDRINDLIGFNGNKVQIYCENKDGRALGRFKILNEYTAETINMYHLLDRVIKKVDQDPEVDTENIDIEPNIPYNLMNISASLGYGLSFNAGSLKVDAIKIRLGASQHIQPTVPAIGVEVDIEGALEVNFGGFNLANVSVSNSRLTLEVGARLDASGYLMTVSWVNDDPFDVDIAWEAALLADILTDELINLGEGGLADYIIDHVGNDFIINLFRSTVESAIFQTPFIMSVLLGAAVTLNSMRMDNSTNEIAIDYLPPVEPDPKPNPFYTGIIGRSVTRLGPGSWQISPPSLGDTWAAGNLMNKIDHIVVVMMENRAFDHVLGYRATLPNAQGAKTD
jgi:hypothetical protein